MSAYKLVIANYHIVFVAAHMDAAVKKDGGCSAKAVSRSVGGLDCL